MTDEQVQQEEEEESESPEQQGQEVDADALAAERDQYLDQLRRVAADFENFRKRAARDQQQLVTRAAERLVTELLPVLDDLGRALEAAEEHSSRYGVGEAGASAPDRLRQAYADEAKLEEGVRLVHRQLAETLRKEGLEEVPTDGMFDPHVHEALLAQPAEGRESGEILDVVQKGYRLGDRVLRPARVVVAE